MKNKSAVLDQFEKKLGSSLSEELLLWFLQKFRSANNFQRLILMSFAALAGLSLFQWSVAIFCVSMNILEGNSGNWNDGTLTYGTQACICSAYTFALYLTYTALDSFKQK